MGMMSGAATAILQPEAPSMRMNRQHAEGGRANRLQEHGFLPASIADERRPTTTQISWEEKNPDWLKSHLISSLLSGR